MLVTASAVAFTLWGLPLPMAPVVAWPAPGDRILLQSLEDNLWTIGHPPARVLIVQGRSGVHWGPWLFTAERRDGGVFTTWWWNGTIASNQWEKPGPLPVTARARAGGGGMGSESSQCDLDLPGEEEAGLAREWIRDDRRQGEAWDEAVAHLEFELQGRRGGQVRREETMG